MIRTRVLTGLAIALCALAAGCGGDDEAADEPITKAEFVEQANAICTKGNAEIEKAGQDVSSRDDAAQFVSETLVPNVEGQLADIRALGFPAGDEDELDALLGQAEDILGEIESDPGAAISDKDPFTPVNGDLQAYGLNACAE